MKAFDKPPAWPCPCGSTHSSGEGVYQCKTGVRTQVIRNGDAGFHIVHDVRRFERPPRYIVTQEGIRDA